jgi:hypothetical protein
MLGKLFSSFDLGKISFGSLSGFIVGLSIIFLIDAFTSEHLTAELLNEKPVGTLLIETIIVILVSGVLGALVSNIYHTFGRWFAGKIWKNLHIAFMYRNCLMEDLGLDKMEFEWIQSKDKNKPSVEEVENKYMLYTEMSGSTAYAILFLAVCLPVFLYYEMNRSPLLCLLVAAGFAIIGIIFIITSAAALAKYEMNKTMSAMDEIRSMSSHNCMFKFAGQDLFGKFPFRLEYWWAMVLVLIIPVFISFLFIMPLGNWIRPAACMEMIGVDAADNRSSILEINVPASPYHCYSTSLIKLKDVFYNLRIKETAEGKSIDLIGISNMPEKPAWSLKVWLGPTVSLSKTVPLNAEFNSSTISDPGSWLLPVHVVEEGRSDKTYILGYIRVNVAKETGK